MRLIVAVYGDEQAEAHLDALGGRARDLTGAWDRLLPQLRREERALFLTRGHGQWPPNRPATIRRKGKTTPLIDTGRLFRALTTRSRGSVGRRSRTQLVFGVNDRTIFWARFVGKRRPFIVDERTARRIGEQAVSDYLRET